MKVVNFMTIKNSILSVFVCGLVATVSFAQNDTSVADSFLTGLATQVASKQNVGDLLVDVTVPSVPALHILGLTSDQVRSPADFKEFRFEVSQLVDDGGAIVGTGGIEFTPLAFLARKPLVQMSRQEYQANKAAQLADAFRWSIGAVTGSDSTDARFAGGFSLLLVDAANPLLDKSLEKGIQEVLAYDRLRLTPEQLSSINPTDVPTGVDIADVIIANRAKADQAYVDSILSSVRSAFRKRTWNATRVSIAGAVSYESMDAKLSSAQFSNVQGWFSARSGWGQSTLWSLCVGAEVDKEIEKWEAFGGLRITHGDEGMGYYAESTFKTDDGETMFRPAIGIEKRLSNGLWFAVGYAEEIRGENYRSSIFNLGNLRWGHSENRLGTEDR